MYTYNQNKTKFDVSASHSIQVNRALSKAHNFNVCRHFLKENFSFFIPLCFHEIFKVQLFWEDLKNLRNLPHVFDIYLVNVKTMRKITQIFVVFSDKLNVMQHSNQASEKIQNISRENFFKIEKNKNTPSEWISEWI